MNASNLYSCFNNAAPSSEQKLRMRNTILEHITERSGVNSTNRNRKRLISAFAAAMAIVLMSTTALAVGFGFLENMFGNNPTVFENIQEDVSFEVLSNSFEGIEFEVTAVYADHASMFLVVDAIAEEPVFAVAGEKNWYVGYTSTGLSKRCPYAQAEGLIASYTVPEGFDAMTLDVHYIDDYRLTLTWLFNQPTADVLADTEHIITVDRLKYYLFDDNGEVIHNHPNLEPDFIPGMAEIKFTVNELAMQNNIRLQPDITLDSGCILHEISINPFGITLSFIGEEENRVFNIDGSLIRMKNGELIDISSPLCNSLGIVSWMAGGRNSNTEADINLIDIVFWSDSTIDVRNVEAIIYKGIEIPIP